MPTVYPSRAGESPSCADRRRRPVVLVDVPPPERLLPLPASPARAGAAALLRGPRRGSGAPWPHRRLGCLAQFCRHCRDAVAKLFAPRQAAAASYGSCASACRLRHRAPEPSASRCPLSSRRHSWPPLAPRRTPWALRIAELTSCAWPAQSGRLGRAAQRAGPVRSTQDSLSALPAQPKAAISPAGCGQIPNGPAGGFQPTCSVQGKISIRFLDLIQITIAFQNSYIIVFSFKIHETSLIILINLISI
jgi:hypothetical protein